MKTGLTNTLSTVSLIVFISANFYGQDKNNFEKIFLKEMQGTNSIEANKFKNVTRLSYYPDTLPGWFFTPPLSTQNCIYAVGISDPDMEPCKAKEMAIHRAKAMAELFCNAKFQYFKDVYTSDKQTGRYTNYRQRFDTYFKISSKSKIDNESYALVDSHITRYNESMILIKYFPKSLPDSIKDSFSVVGTVLFVEAQVEDAFEVQAEYELLSALQQPDSEIQSTHFLYREKGNKFLSNSQYLNTTVEFPVYIYKYASPDWSKNTPPLISYNGLWSRLTREFLRYLTLTTEKTKTKVKNLGELYNPATSNLSREIVSYIAHLKLNGIVFERDSMKLNLSINEITP